MIDAPTGWKVEDKKLVRQYQFGNFSDAFAFLTQVAIAAEKASHHPEIFNVYNKVTLRLSTHDANDDITEKDQKLAEAINALSN